MFEIMHPIGAKNAKGEIVAGDAKQYWNRNNEFEVAQARETFRKYVKEKKYAAFAMSRTGDKEQQVTEFDPSLERVLFVAPVSGG
jgi:hypothetical protein